MTKEQERKLIRIKHYATRYELILANRGDSYLVVYSSSRSRGVVFDSVHKWAQQIIAITGEDEMKMVKGGATLGDWKVRWSGRTQREAILEGELPFVGDY